MADDGVDILDDTTLEVVDHCDGPVGGRCPRAARTGWWPAPAAASTPPTGARGTGCCRCPRVQGNAPLVEPGGDRDVTAVDKPNGPVEPLLGAYRQGRPR